MLVLNIHLLRKFQQLICNKAGKFIKPSITSISAAGKSSIPADTRVMLTNSDAALAYPISGFTWILIYKDQIMLTALWHKLKLQLNCWIGC